MKPRWKFFPASGGGKEPFLINSPLLIANHKGRSTVAKRTTRKKNPRRKRASMRAYNPAALFNRKKAKRRRRNPPGLSGMSIGGIPLPPLDRALLAAAGALGPEMVEMLVEEFAPDFVSTEAGQGAVAVGSYIVPPLLAYMLLGRRAAGDVAFGALINIGIVGGRKLISSVMESTPAVAGYLDRGAGVGKYYIPAGSMAGYASSQLNFPTPERLRGREPLGALNRSR